MSSEKWWQRLKKGLKKTSDHLGEQIHSIFKGRKFDQQTLDELGDILIQSDVGIHTAQHLREFLSKQRFNQDTSEQQIKNFLAEEIERILTPLAVPLTIEKTDKITIVLMVGVNGAGKTTTIGKLTKKWIDQGLKVELAACDTFRAAAVEQLQVWGQRLNIDVHTANTGSDAAGLAFNAITKAQNNKADIICIDTAGRLQNKENLMDELKKIIRVIKKIDPSAPHHTLLALDATTGQNAYNQVAVFQEAAHISGLIMAKLDGTARGGNLIGLADRFKLPIYAIGLGEQVDDLQSFDAKGFARTIVGIETESYH